MRFAMAGKIACPGISYKLPGVLAIPVYTGNRYPGRIEIDQVQLLTAMRIMAYITGHSLAVGMLGM
jgi:hypothetical protein